MRALLRSVLIASCGLATGVAAAATTTVVEYYAASLDHYFITSLPNEIQALDQGAFGGAWKRTGQLFQAWPNAAAGPASAVPVCRVFISYAGGSSHFYSGFANECAAASTTPGASLYLETPNMMYLQMASAAGTCPVATQDVYRLWDNRSDSNHRYTTDVAIRDQMMAKGWVLEGSGPGFATMCAPYPFTIVAAGDIAQCFNGPASSSAAARTAALVTSQDALVLTLGDHAYENGTPAEFAGCFHPTWGAFKDRIHPAPGNHEYYTAGAEGYFGYFGAQAGPDRRGYYSFDYGGWHFISLDSLVDVSALSAQYLWLQSDLAASSASLCTIAYWHYPAFNSGGEYGSIMEMRPFFDALYNGGVEMVLSGHEHIYERFAPQKADGTADPARGVRQFVVGTGGHTLNTLGTPLPNSEFRTNTSWGVLRLTLGDGSYGWQFVPVGGGAPLDAGTGTCHR